MATKNKKTVEKKAPTGEKKVRKKREPITYTDRLVKRISGFGSVLSRLADQCKRTKNDFAKATGEALAVAVEALGTAKAEAEQVPQDFVRSGGNGAASGWVPDVGDTVTWSPSKAETYSFLAADSITVDAIHGEGRGMRCEVTLRAKGQQKKNLIVAKSDLAPVGSGEMEEAS
jgi:hypothetical protein